MSSHSIISSTAMEYISPHPSELEVYQQTTKMSLQDINTALMLRNIPIDPSMSHGLAARQLSKILIQELRAATANTSIQSLGSVLKPVSSSETVSSAGPMLTSPAMMMLSPNRTNQRVTPDHFPHLMFFQERRSSLLGDESIDPSIPPSPSCESLSETASMEWLSDTDKVVVRCYKKEGINGQRLSNLSVEINNEVDMKIAIRKNQIIQEYQAYRKRKKEIYDLKCQLYCDHQSEKTLYQKKFAKLMSTKKKQLKVTLNEYIRDEYKILKHKIRNVKRKKLPKHVQTPSFSLFFRKMKDMFEKPEYKNDPYYESLMASSDLDDKTKDSIFKSLCYYRWKLEQEYADKYHQNLIFK